MSYRLHRWTIVLAALVSLASGPVFAQSQRKPSSSTPVKSWTPPKTPSGDPDLQGIWTSTTTAPFERPPQFGNRLFLTDEEYAETEKRLERQLEVDSQDTISPSARRQHGPAGALDRAGQPRRPGKRRSSWNRRTGECP